MNRRTFLNIGTAATLTAGLGNGVATYAVEKLPEITAGRLPRWRGFNLLEKFTLDGNKPFVEQDFAWMSKWGFNFARLPLDYRCWAKTPEAKFNESVLREIDQAVAWGKKFGIHVSLNFHRGPGYCVNDNPKEVSDLWSDQAIQKQFARHWGFFAKRYAGLSNREVSFDLINEPPQITGLKCAAALKPAIEAIKAADAKRLIIADGLSWGREPVSELISAGIAQSMHCYDPMEVTHFKASWVPGSDKYSTPVWPLSKGINGYLYGTDKAEFKSPLILQVQCPQALKLVFRVDRVSSSAGLVVQANGVEVFKHLLKPGPGDGEWKRSTANQWGSYNGEYDRDYTMTVPAGTREIRFSVEQGDWLTFSSIRLGDTVIKVASQEWGEKQGVYNVSSKGVKSATGRYSSSKEILWAQRIKPWLDLQAKGVGVHVGEFGVYNKTPHEVTLAWMRDCLENFKTAGFGWALWNFRGSFGILDSARADVKYEDYQGHKLDRRMLDLLRKL